MASIAKMWPIFLRQPLKPRVLFFQYLVALLIMGSSSYYVKCPKKCTCPMKGYQVKCENVTFGGGTPPDLKYYGSIKSASITDDLGGSVTFIAMNTLTIRNCSVSSLPEKYLEHNPHIQLFDFEDNNISSLPKDLFQYTPLIVIISLKNNHITSLPEYLFRGLTKLEAIDLALNKLVSLPNAIFKGLRSIYFLSLAKNKITFLPKTVIADIKERITMLDLYGNRLSFIQKNAFTRAKKLELIVLANNNIKDLGSMSFSKSARISSIIIEINKLQIIKKRTFYFLQNVVSINLSKNRIHTIEDDAFESVPQLQVLTLDDNRLRTTSTSWAANIPSMIALLLTRNPLQSINMKDFHQTAVKRLYVEASSLKEMLLYRNIEVSGITVSFSTSDTTQEIQLAETRNNSDVFIATMASSGFYCTLNTCTLCGSGSYLTAYSEVDKIAWTLSCKKCPAGGFYQDDPQATILNEGYNDGCKACTRGTFVSIENAPGESLSDCGGCPFGTDLNELAGFRACKCLKGFYRTDRFGPCMKCPSNGLECKNEVIILKPGFFWLWDSNVKKEAYINFTRHLPEESKDFSVEYSKYEGNLPIAIACPIQVACKGGIRSQCSKGRTGNLCNACSEGYYKSVTSACLKCSPWWIIGQLVTIVAVTLFVTGVVFRREKSKRDRRSNFDLILARVKIIIGFYQVTSSMIQSLSFEKWPEELSQLGSYLQVLQLNLLQAIPVNCISSTLRMNAFQKMFFMVSANVCFVIAASVVYHIRKWQVYKYDITDEEKKTSITKTKEKTYRLVLFLLFITFPSTTDSIIRVMPFACHKLCSEQKCSWQLKSDYEIKCFDNYYNSWLQIAYMSFIYPVVLALLAFRLLWKYSNNNDDNGEIQGNELRYGASFLSESYRTECWYWELVETTRKVLLTSGFLLMAEGNWVHVHVTATLSLGYAAVFAFIKPMKDYFENIFQVTSLMATFVNLTLTVMTLTELKESESDKALTSVLFVGANVILLVIIGCENLWVLYQNVKTWAKNPHCTLECLFAFALSILQFLGSFVGASSTDNLREQAVVGKLDAATIENELNAKVGFEVDVDDEDGTEEGKSSKGTEGGVPKGKKWPLLFNPRLWPLRRGNKENEKKKVVPLLVVGNVPKASKLLDENTENDNSKQEEPNPPQRSDNSIVLGDEDNPMPPAKEAQVDRHCSVQQPGENKSEVKVKMRRRMIAWESEDSPK